MILNVTNSRASYYLGGTEVVSLFQALYLARLGHTIRYFVRDVPEAKKSEYFRSFERQARELPIEIVPIKINDPVDYGDGSWAKWYREAIAFGACAQRAYYNYDEADLFVAHLATDALFAPVTMPCVLHLHGAPSQTDALMDAAMLRPDYAVAHAASIKEWWHEHYPALPMELFRNGVETDAFHASPDAERDIDVLYVGRMLPHKGIDDILHAVPKDAHVVIAGNGTDISEFERIAKRRDLSHVEFILRPDNKTLRSLYARSKLFACPSRAKEGVLTTMLEAGASGCAIITASGSGMTDLAVDRVNSIIVSPGDVSALRDGIGTLLSDGLQRITLATAMQEEISRAWSWQKKAKELEEIYDGFIEDHAATR